MTSLRDRIAALEQRSTSPSQLQSQNDKLGVLSSSKGHLKDKIATFEKKGGTPVPRSALGLGAPPVQNRTASRELYGNRFTSTPMAYPQASLIRTPSQDATNSTRRERRASSYGYGAIRAQLPPASPSHSPQEISSIPTQFDPGAYDDSSSVISSSSPSIPNTPQDTVTFVNSASDASDDTDSPFATQSYKSDTDSPAEVMMSPISDSLEDATIPIVSISSISLKLASHSTGSSDFDDRDPVKEVPASVGDSFLNETTFEAPHPPSHLNPSIHDSTSEGSAEPSELNEASPDTPKSPEMANMHLVPQITIDPSFSSPSDSSLVQEERDLPLSSEGEVIGSQTDVAADTNILVEKNGLASKQLHAGDDEEDHLSYIPILSSSFQHIVNLTAIQDVADVAENQAPPIFAQALPEEEASLSRDDVHHLSTNNTRAKSLRAATESKASNLLDSQTQPQVDRYMPGYLPGLSRMGSDSSLTEATVSGSGVSTTPPRLNISLPTIGSLSPLKLPHFTCSTDSTPLTPDIMAQFPAVPSNTSEFSQPRNEISDAITQSPNPRTRVVSESRYPPPSNTKSKKHIPGWYDDDSDDEEGGGWASVVVTTRKYY